MNKTRVLQNIGEINEILPSVGIHYSLGLFWFLTPPFLLTSEEKRTFPLFFLLLDWCRRGRVLGSEGEDSGGRVRGRGRGRGRRVRRSVFPVLF
jgi:hypothetical protein